MGMTISISGTLSRAADVCKRSRDWKHLEWNLRELQKHLDELYQRRVEPGILEEFFAVWSAPSKE